MTYMSHAEDCLQRLWGRGREWWPDGLRARTDLCTCEAIPGALLKQPEFAETRQEVEDYIRAGGE